MSKVKKTVKKTVRDVGLFRMNRMRQVTKAERLAALSKMQRKSATLAATAMVEVIAANLETAESVLDRKDRPKFKALRTKLTELFGAAFSKSLDNKYGPAPKRGRPAKK